MRTLTIDFREFLNSKEREHKAATSCSPVLGIIAPPSFFIMPPIIKNAYFFVIALGVVLLSLSKFHDRLKDSGRDESAGQLYTFVTWGLKTGYLLGLLWLANEFRKNLL